MAEQTTGFFSWLQDNARILLSIAFVLFLLYAVYSYSQRTNTVTPVSDQTATEEAQEVSLEAQNNDTADTTAEVSLGDTTDTIGVDKATSTQDDATATAQKADNDASPTVQNGRVDYSDDVITVSAARGEGITHLARHATAAYLTNHNIDLSAEEKIYVEDFLRKSVPAQNVYPGSSIAFTQELIKTGIERAQALTDEQKANLAQYAARAAL